MHSTVYEKSSKFRARRFAYRLVMLLLDVTYLTLLMHWLDQQATVHVATVSPLFHWKFIRNALLCSQPATLSMALDAGWLVKWSVTQDNVCLNVTSPDIYLVNYNLCYETCKCIKMIWFQSGKWIFHFWNKFIILVYSNQQKSLPPWKLKSPPKSGISQNRTHSQRGQFRPCWIPLL